MSQIFAELELSLQKRQVEGKPIQVFFRDDDVDEEEESLRRLLGIFFTRMIPVSLAVIPGRLTDRAIKLLDGYRGDRPDLIELNQHGWRHINHETSGRKSEFGASRDFQAQLDDIMQGKSKMIEAFGSDWFPAFIPPWNRCTEVTYRALDQSALLVLSKGKGGPTFEGYRMREIPITLDMYRWQNGPAMKPQYEIVSDLKAQVKRGERVGILLHHRVMTDEAFSFLESLLLMLNQHPAIKFHTFRSILASDQMSRAEK